MLVLLDFGSVEMPCNSNYKIGWQNDTPHTSKYAKPTDWEEVKNVLAVKITNAYYRDSVFNGIFEVADRNKIYVSSPKGRRVVVKAYWYCARPSTKWISILIENAECEELPNYSGKVVRNIGQ